MSIVLYAARSSFPIIVVKNHVRIGIPCSLKDTAHKNIYTVHSNSVIRSSRNVCKFLKMANNDDQPYKFIRHPYLSSLCFPLFSFCSPARSVRICSRGRNNCFHSLSPIRFKRCDFCWRSLQLPADFSRSCASRLSVAFGWKRRVKCVRYSWTWTPAHFERWNSFPATHTENNGNIKIYNWINCLSLRWHCSIGLFNGKCFF